MISEAMFAPLTVQETATAQEAAEKDEGIAVVPVPDDAPTEIPLHRLGGPQNIWEYRNAQGQILQRACRFISPDGRKEDRPLTYREFRDGSRRWVWKALDAPRPLYGLDRLAKNPDAPVIVCEGEKATDAATALFPDHVAVTSPNGAGSAHKADWTPLAGRRIIIWPDHDEDGKKYAQAVAELAKSAGAAFVSIVTVPDEFPEKWDLADGLPGGRTQDDLDYLLNEAESNTAPYVPAGFMIADEGVFRLNDNGAIDLAVCDPLYIEALARDDGGHNWGRLLVWHDPDGRRHEWAMPNNMLAGDGAEYRRFLLDNGLGIRAGRTAQNALHDYIMTAAPLARAVSVSIPGWHGRRYIAVDGTAYGHGDDRMLLQVSGTLPRTENRGTLDGWRDSVAACAAGNSRLVFSIAAAFAGPLLYFANEGSGGFHFSGESSGGKTTALRVASSVWGQPLRSWRTTDNAAESWARFANDGFLAIDELGQVDGRAADQMAYMLGNGQTKGRANRDGMARDTTEFRLMFLSTGEIGLAEKIGEGKKKAKAGQAVRMIEIPADAGQGMRLFEELHGYTSADELAKYLRQATEENRGHAAAVWLEKLSKMESDRLRSAISELTAEWMAEHVQRGADGQVTRAARRFALVAVAGELAGSFGIVPWPDKEARNAAARCFKDWLTARGGAGSYEAQGGIADILGFISRHGNSRFQDMDGGNNEKVHDRAGWKRNTENGQEYLMLRATFRDEILGGSQNEQEIVRVAIESGLIIPDGEGKSTRSVTLPGFGKKRVLCIVPARHKDGVA